MGTTTEYYNLYMHGPGEVYSSLKDQIRFVTIDNQMAFITDRIGPGVIDGWDISVESLPDMQIRIASGFGIIGRTVRFSYGPFIQTLSNNRTYYVYMQSRGIIGGFSGYADVSTLVYGDVDAPAVPAAPIVTATGSYTISVSWTSSAESDLSHYVLRRTTTPALPASWEEITTTTSTTYSDTGLSQNTIYYYDISAVDFTGNASAYSADGLAMTQPDMSTPISPLSFSVFPGDGVIQVLWQLSPTSLVNSYRLEIQEVNQSYEAVGSPLVSIYGSSRTYAIVKGLTNSTVYQVTLYAVTVNGVLSDDLTEVAVPIASSVTGEVDEISVTWDKVHDDSDNLRINIFWLYTPDPYFSEQEAYQFVLTLIENNAYISDPYEISGSDISHSLTILSYRDDNNLLRHRYIRELTVYFVRIQIKTANGDLSNGVTLRVDSPILNAPSSPTNLEAIRQPDQTVFFSWRPSSSDYMSHYFVSAQIENLETSVITTITTDENVGLGTSYTADSTFFADNLRYRFQVRGVDVYGNESSVKTVFLQIIDADVTKRPEPPDNQRVEPGDKSVSLTWDVDTSGQITNYRVYRAIFSTVLHASSFTLLETAPNDQGSYLDLEVENGTTYAYIISSVSALGSESPNPINDSSFTLTLLTVKPTSSAIFTEPEGLTSAAIGGTFNVQLNWTAAAGDFDGFQIYRSSLNKYSWEYVDSVTAGQVAYVDVGALLEDGIYYYTIRKYRNEVIPFITTSSAAPSDSVIIGLVATSGGSISIDQTVIRELKDLEDVVGDAVQEAVDEHKHTLIDRIDRRIDLNGDVIVTDWTTLDYKRYTTTVDIEGADNYIIHLSGTLNEDYFKDDDGNVNQSLYQQAATGTPVIGYDIEESNGIITFQGFLYTDCEEPAPDPLDPDRGLVCPKTPYSVAPTLELELIGLSEVQGILPKEKVGTISTTQVDGGTISDIQMPNVNHDGRIKERLLPVQIQCVTDNDFLYSPIEAHTELGTANTFYDFLPIGSGDEILAATSVGIAYSSTGGNLWEIVGTIGYPITRLVDAPEFNFILALTSNSVYYSDNQASAGWSNWIRMNGLDNVKVIRDVVEDSSGNMYVTTDLGVYKLNVNKAYVLYTWEQLSIFGPRSTEAYAILYDTPNARLIVSNELGILESYDEGATWTLTTELTEFRKIFSFIRNGNHIFALGNHAIYRKTGIGNFVKISDIDADISRKMTIHRNRIFVTTNEGPMGTTSGADILSDTGITMVTVWPEMNIFTNTIPVTALEIVRGVVYVGTDRRLFTIDSDGVMSIRYEEQNTSIPSVYIDGVLQIIGFHVHLSSSASAISFDERQNFNAAVTVANKYNKYVAEFGGWAGTKYDSDIKLYLQHSIYAESNTISLTMSEFTGFEFPIYTEHNANTATADTYKANAETSILNLQNNPGAEALYTFVSTIFNDIEKFLSQLNPEARVNTATGTDGTTTITMLVLPKIETDLFLADTTTNADMSVNTTTGVFTMDKTFDKYDVFSLDILGCTVTNDGTNTHREIEDDFEIANSGLYSSISQVQHVNIVKLGIFDEKTWPGQQSRYSTPKRASYIVPRNTQFFDTLNSTVNYNLRQSITDITLSLTYPASVIYISNVGKILVGGRGGLLSIDTNTLNMDEIQVSTLVSPAIRDLMYVGDVLYAITTSSVYYSSDYGATWTLMTRSGLPNDIYRISFVANNFVVGGEDGVYFRSSTQDTWVRSLESQSPVEVMYGPDLLFLVSDNKLYATGDGVSFLELKVTLPGQVNSIAKFKLKTYIATSVGLYTDGGTLYGSRPMLSLIDLLGDNSLSAQMVVNDVYGDDSTLVIGVSDASYYNLENNTFEFKEFSQLNTIHKVLAINGATWLFGYDLMKSPSLDYPTRLTTGVPL